MTEDDEKFVKELEEELVKAAEAMQKQIDAEVFSEMAQITLQEAYFILHNENLPE